MHGHYPWFLIAVSIFVLAAVALDWNWFFEHRKARLFVRILGRQGARAAYAVLGLFLGALGVATLVTG